MRAARPSPPLPPRRLPATGLAHLLRRPHLPVLRLLQLLEAGLQQPAAAFGHHCRGGKEEPSVEGRTEQSGEGEGKGPGGSSPW